MLSLHGGGSSGSALVRWLTPWKAYNDKAYANGFAVVIPESTDRDKAWWSTELSLVNPDILYVKEVIETLEGMGKLPRGLTKVATGHSNGGNFLCALGHYEGFHAGVIVNASWFPRSYELPDYKMPALWVGSNRDTVVPYEKVVASHERMKAMGIRTELYDTGGSHLFNGKFDDEMLSFLKV